MVTDVMAEAGTNMSIGCPGITRNTFVVHLEWRCRGQCGGISDVGISDIYGGVMKELCRPPAPLRTFLWSLNGRVKLSPRAHSRAQQPGYSHTASIRTNFKCRRCQVVLWVRYFMFWEFRGEGLRSGLWLPRYKLLHLLGSSQVYTSLDICNWLKLLVWRYCCDLICRAEFCHT